MPARHGRAVQPPGQLHAVLADAVPVGGDEHVALVGGFSRQGRALDGGGGLLFRPPVSVKKQKNKRMHVIHTPYIVWPRLFENISSFSLV